MGNNWIELNLSKEEEEFVREASVIYKATYVETIDSVFKIAEAIHILNERHYRSGVQGAFAEALVQYGFTKRDGETAIDSGIRSNLETLRKNEAAVREWWKDVPERKKRDWLSARAIHRHWKANQKPVDPDKPRPKTPLQREKATTQLLQEKLREANQLLKTADGGNLFTAESPTEHIANAIYDMRLRSPKMTPSKMRDIASYLNKLAKQFEARVKEARPKQKQRGKAAPLTERQS